MIEAHALRPMMGYGYDDFDVEIAFVDDGDDDAVVVVVAVYDDCANECHAVMYVAFLRFSLHVRPTNYHPAMNSMATKLDCMQPMMCTFQPLIETVVHFHMIVNNYRHVHCSSTDLGCCC